MTAFSSDTTFTSPPNRLFCAFATFERVSVMRMDQLSHGFLLMQPQVGSFMIQPQPWTLNHCTVIVDHGSDNTPFRLGHFRKCWGAEMSAFIKNEFKAAPIVDAMSINIYDRITMIDETYRNDDRSTCAAMIDELYAIFDEADQST